MAGFGFLNCFFILIFVIHQPVQTMKTKSVTIDKEILGGTICFGK